jgi:hypothetical protein
VWCREKQHWTINGEWKNVSFTDEMSIEVGGSFGISLVWRDKTERWHTDCVEATKKQGP